MTAELRLTLKELDVTPGLDYWLLDFWATNGSVPSWETSLQLIKQDGSFVVPKSPPPPDTTSVSGTYQVLAPVLHNQWCLLGEAFKIVPASSRRFFNVRATPDGGLAASIKAASEEVVELWLLAPALSLQAAVKRGSERRTTSTQSGSMGQSLVHVVCAPASTCSTEDCDVFLSLVCTVDQICSCE